MERADVLDERRARRLRESHEAGGELARVQPPAPLDDEPAEERVRADLLVEILAGEGVRGHVDRPSAPPASAKPAACAGAEARTT